MRESLTSHINDLKQTSYVSHSTILIPYFSRTVFIFNILISFIQNNGSLHEVTVAGRVMEYLDLPSFFAVHIRNKKTSRRSKPFLAVLYNT